jgi:hypothetical protein
VGNCRPAGHRELANDGQGSGCWHCTGTASSAWNGHCRLAALPAAPRAAGQSAAWHVSCCARLLTHTNVVADLLTPAGAGAAAPVLLKNVRERYPSPSLFLLLLLRSLRLLCL